MWGIPEVSRCRWNPFPEGWNSRCNNGLKIHKLLLYVATGSSTFSLKVFLLVVSTNPKERLCPNNGTCICGEWSEKRSTPLFMSHDRHIDSQFLNTRWAALAIPSYLVGQNKAWLIEKLDWFRKMEKNKKNPLLLNFNWNWTLLNNVSHPIHIQLPVSFKVCLYANLFYTEVKNLGGKSGTETAEVNEEIPKKINK